MSFDRLLNLVNHVPLASLDTLSRDVWRATGEGSLTEIQAQELAEAIHGRRKPHHQTSAISLACLKAVSSQISPEMASNAPGAIKAKAPRLWSYFPAKSLQRSPDRAKSVERRRTLAASGPLPPKLACKFTTGELAVLKVVADAFVAEGQCTLSVPEIAARAGVGRTKARLSLRIAESLGLVSITERRVDYRPNLTNMVRIVSPAWLVWLARWTPRSKVSDGVGEKGATPRASRSTPGLIPKASSTPIGQREGSLLRGPRNQRFTRKKYE